MKPLRAIRLFCQRMIRGWDDSDTWSLNTTIAEFVYPRLKRFIEIRASIPIGMTGPEWDEILNKILFAFGLEVFDMCEKKQNVAGEIEINWAEYWKGGDYYRECWDRHREGIDLFVKYHQDLWW